MMKKYSALFFLMTLFVTSSFAGGVSQFFKLQENILQKISSYEAKTVSADELAAGDLRQYLFTLETLAKLYSQVHPELKDIERTSKGLEDELGAYRKSVELLSYARNSGASAEKVQRLTAANKQALVRLENYLKSTGWGNAKSGEIKRIKNILNGIAWASEKDEQNNAYRALSQQLLDWAEVPWNMDVLEGGTGIHDLRKEVRWYKLEMSALNNMMGVQSQTCDQGATLPQNEANGRCLISACLHERLLKTYDFFGSIKDEGEALEGVGGHLNDGKYKDAKDFYKALRKDQIFEKLAKEIRSCATNKE